MYKYIYFYIYLILDVFYTSVTLNRCLSTYKILFTALLPTNCGSRWFSYVGDRIELDLLVEVMFYQNIQQKNEQNCPTMICDEVVACYTAATKQVAFIAKACGSCQANRVIFKLTRSGNDAV